jgi:tripartite-type tricarboxylate transporter receptor subunit TctC
MRLSTVTCSLATVVLIGSAAMFSPDAAAADYPTRPITIIVGYSPGGANDALARIAADKLTVALGQPVIVENRPGVAAIVGASTVAKAKPDGYTLLMGASGPMVFNYALYGSLPYAPQDFAPISLMGTFPMVLLTQADNPANSIEQIVEFSRQNPAKANYGSSAASFQLIMELFNNKTGARFSHIPYKGSNDSIKAVLADDVTITLVDAGPALTAVQGGRVKALAVTAGERLKEFPNVPTMSEAGVDLEVKFWSGLFAPAGTPEIIIKRLQREIARIVDLPDVRRRMSTLLITPTANTSEEFARLIATEIPFWKKVATDNAAAA